MITARRRAVHPVICLLLVFVAVMALAGCGSDSSDGDGTVALNSATQIAVDQPSSSGLKEPAGSPEAILAKLPQLQRAAGQPQLPTIVGSAGLTVPDWLNAVDIDVNNFWQQEFNQADLQYTAPAEVIFDTPVPTGCTNANVDPSVDGPGPFYCYRDQTIYLPVGFFDAETDKFGDAGPAIIVAHEIGHRVQDLLGIAGPGSRPLMSIQIELEADCFAGVWAHSVFSRGYLEDGDVAEMLGETDSAADPAGTPINAPDAHGTAQMRVAEFKRGLIKGQPANCRVRPVPQQ